MRIFTEEESLSVGDPSIDARRLLSGPYWGELRTFLAVAKSGSLNRAAEELGMSRMTVGREVRRLQDAIGAQLIQIGKFGAPLTRHGEELARACQRLDQDIRTLTDNLRFKGYGARGVVRLSAADEVPMAFVLGVVRRLANYHPSIRVELKRAQKHPGFVGSDIDLMFGSSPEEDLETTAVEVGALRYSTLADEAYLERNGTPSSHNLDNHHFVEFERYLPQKEAWRRWRQLTERGYIAYRCDDYATYEMIVKSGLGIGLLPNDHVSCPNLKTLELDCVVDVPLFLIASRERLENKAVRLVYDCVAHSCVELCPRRC
jgi:DNA-binding transcriptional LysR family regulator